MSLYRKYRPQTFSHLVGQDHINRTLQNALLLEKVNHAFLFTGPRGTGKTSSARLMAKAINCTSLKDAEPCNQCEICTDINESKLIDLIEIDAASNRGIDEMRDLKEKINFSPTRAKSKVYIIDEVHMLTKEAFNALLKTLEEPPNHVYFILATTEAHKIPETILSRCQRFDFKRISEKVLIDRLKFIAGEEGITAEDKALELIAHHCEGGMRDAIGLLEQLTVDGALKYDHVCDILGVSGIASIENLFSFLRDGKIKEALNEIDSLYMEGFDLAYFNKRFLEFLRKKMILAVENGVGSVGGNGNELPWILETISFFERAYEQSRHTLIPQLPLETACVKSVLKNNIGGNSGVIAAHSVNVAPAVSKPVEEATAVPNVSAPTVEREHKSIKSAETPVKKPSDVVITPISENLAPESQKKNSDVKGFELAMFQESWNEILDLVKTPVVKRTLMNGRPYKVEGNKLVVAFSNMFNINKMSLPESLDEIEKAIETRLGVHAKVCGEVNTDIVRPMPKKHDEADAGKLLEAKAMDIFGGTAD